MIPDPETLYLDPGGEPVFATLHRPAPELAGAHAVLICPPFGWDEVCSYRSLRVWAARLAQAGHATLRITLPGTGDSGAGPRDPDRVGAWANAVSLAARRLAAESPAAHVAALGIGLGGFVAMLGVAGGAPIDELVIWGAQSRARSLVRQLRAFSKLEAARFFDGLPPPPPLPAGDLEAGGFLLDAETVRALEAIDLAAAPLPAGCLRRALLLDRDGLAVDPRLLEHLQGAGAEVTLAPGPGYGSMTSHPQQVQPPWEVIDRVGAWLAECSAPAPRRTPTSKTAAGAVRSVEIRVPGGAAVRETPVSIPQTFGALSGVLVEPLEPAGHSLRVLLLNAGAARRIGPSRMWVECARRWAAWGLPTLRLDVQGIGEADGENPPYMADADLYVPELVPQVLSALDFLQDRDGGERFILAGLCAGAYWAFHGALRDPRVDSAVMVNPRALIWDTGLGPARDLRALLHQPFSLTRIRRVATRPRLRSFLRWLLAAPPRALRRIGSRRAPDTAADQDTALDQMRASGKRILMLFSDHEPLYDELTSSGTLARISAWPNVRIERILVRDHTLRPGWAQVQAHAILDMAIQAELARVWSALPPSSALVTPRTEALHGDPPFTA